MQCYFVLSPKLFHAEKGSIIICCVTHFHYSLIWLIRNFSTTTCVFFHAVFPYLIGERFNIIYAVLFSHTQCTIICFAILPHTNPLECMCTHTHTNTHMCTCTHVVMYMVWWREWCRLFYLYLFIFLFDRNIVSLARKKYPMVISSFMMHTVCH